MSHRRTIAAALAAILWLAAPLARGDEGPLAWDSLPEAEQALLREHAEDWDGYPPELRWRLHRNAQRFLRMTPRERHRLREEGARRFHRMSPREKRRACRRFYRERGHVPPFCRRFF